MKAHKRDKKAVTYLVSIVLMTLIAVALSTLLYAYFSGWIGARTAATGPVGALSIDEAYYNSNQVVLFVRNAGSGNVTITNAYIDFNNGTIRSYNTSNGGITGQTELAPGTTGKITISTVHITSSTHLITVKIVGSDGSQAVVQIKT